MDPVEYEASLFKTLYHLRWGIEENYKRLKQWVEIENFSGKSALSVKQDFYAKIIASNLTSLMALAAQKEVDKKTQKLQLTYQVNFAQALSKMKNQINTSTSLGRSTRTHLSFMF
jgi:IS4 transposase